VITDHTPETLRAFEAQIAADFDAAKIRAPVHLAGGNEQQLLDVFQHIREEDWVLTQWRSHFHCLLKGISPTTLREDILAGRSITLCYPEHRILSSAIVGGTLPIGVGIAMAIKRSGGTEKVWCFVGDMTARAGMFHECKEYAAGHGLPICFVVEDNGLSVCSDTAEAWGKGVLMPWVRSYRYHLGFPHSGAGKRVNF
jgi:TPP-dependent pyruvate/acetoin dehydrogenase alpha subunit